MVKDLTPAGKRKSRIGPILRIDDDLALFGAFGEGSLHRTDGTAKGTKIVRRPRDGGPGSVRVMTRVQGIGALFQGYSALWASDGSRAGTIQVVEFRPTWITAFGEQRALFVADDGVHGTGGVDHRRNPRRDRTPQGHQLLAGRPTGPGRAGSTEAAPAASHAAAAPRDLAALLGHHGFSATPLRLRLAADRLLLG